MGALARAEANRVVGRGNLPPSLARRRALVRKATEKLMYRIDEAVRDLLGM